MSRRPQAPSAATGASTRRRGRHWWRRRIGDGHSDGQFRRWWRHRFGRGDRRRGRHCAEGPTVSGGGGAGGAATAKSSAISSGSGAASSSASAAAARRRKHKRVCRVGQRWRGGAPPRSARRRRAAGWSVIVGGRGRRQWGDREKLDHGSEAWGVRLTPAAVRYPVGPAASFHPQARTVVQVGMLHPGVRSGWRRRRSDRDERSNHGGHGRGDVKRERVWRRRRRNERNGRGGRRRRC